jgi:asparagine synthase (glutamine-hydrolysing)
VQSDRGALASGPRSRADPGTSAPEAVYLQELDRRFESALADSISGAAAVTILFSGGLDSGVIAHSLRSALPVELLTISCVGGRDRLQATRAARAIGLTVRVVEFTDREVSDSLMRLNNRAGSLREPARSVQVALGMAMKAATHDRVLAGQGADELFGGYAHFRGLEGESLQERRRSDWERLVQRDWSLSEGLALDLGKELRSPYLDGSLSDWALARPLDPVDSVGLTKPLMRSWARSRGLPGIIVDQPKVALQYGSGVGRSLSRLDRSALARG